MLVKGATECNFWNGGLAKLILKWKYEWVTTEKAMYVITYACLKLKAGLGNPY